MVHFWRPAFRCFIQPSETPTAPWKNSLPQPGFRSRYLIARHTSPWPQCCCSGVKNPPWFFFRGEPTSFVNKGSNKENKIECSLYIYIYRFYYLYTLYIVCISIISNVNSKNDHDSWVLSYHVFQGKQLQSWQNCMSMTLILCLSIGEP